MCKMFDISQLWTAKLSDVISVNEQLSKTQDTHPSFPHVFRPSPHRLHLYNEILIGAASFRKNG